MAFQPRRFHLPVNHEPAMVVPDGGSRCSNCRFFNPTGGGPYGTCGSEDYARYYGTNLIPWDPNAFCSDWYEPNEALPQVWAG